ncbi:uncharacterized protein [Lolium perenne]|uniref:uncharacterized protein n=1 Tax=Lolium perenne TaxID=4522 RepID=UPI003A9A095E
MDLFYSATTINLGNGKKTPFWQAPWLQGRKPIDIAPLIFGSSKRKNWKVAQALHNDAWVSKIDLEGTFTIDHMAQFIDLWTLISTIHLDPDVDDDIVWRLTANGHYSAKSAYELQFLGSLLSPMNKLIWKAWAPPKVKFFAWLLYQNRIWTADRLAKRGWPNCGLCPLCKQCTETHDHLFVHCRYTTRLWGFVKDWMGTNAITPLQWANHDIHSWWDSMTGGHVPNRKAMASVALLVSWELWNERNARVFNAKSSLAFEVVHVEEDDIFDSMVAFYREARTPPEDSWIRLYLDQEARLPLAADVSGLAEEDARLAHLVRHSISRIKAVHR